MEVLEIERHEEGSAQHRGIERVVRAVSTAMLFLAGVGIVFMAMATAYEVVARYAFNSPTTWATELSTYALIATIFFGASYAQMTGAHVRVDILLSSLGPVARDAIVKAGSWVALIVVIVIAWQSWILLLKDYQTGSRIMAGMM